LDAEAIGEAVQALEANGQAAGTAQASPPSLPDQVRLTDFP